MPDVLKSNLLTELYSQAFLELGEINDNLGFVDFIIKVQKPILESRKNILESFVHQLHESIDNEKTIRENNSGYEKYNNYSFRDLKNGSSSLLSSKRSTALISHTKPKSKNTETPEYLINDEIVARISYYLEERGKPCLTTDIYNYLVQHNFLEPYGVRIFGLKLAYYNQDVICQIKNLKNGKHGWDIVRDKTQQEIRVHRHKTVSDKSNKHVKFLSLPRNQHPLVIAVSEAFLTVDQEPKTSQELWGIISRNKKLVNKCSQQGIEKYIDLIQNLNQYKDFFAQDEKSAMFYPVK